MSLILGIDPGLVSTGWAVVQAQANDLIYIDHGTIKTKSSDDISLRLGILSQKLEETVIKYQLSSAAIEHTFVNNNYKSALMLAMARGALISVPARHGLKVHEYSANVIKKAVVGFGHADKSQVQYMVKIILQNIPKQEIQNDAADALAIAITHANTNDFNTTFAKTI